MIFESDPRDQAKLVAANVKDRTIANEIKSRSKRRFHIRIANPVRGSDNLRPNLKFLSSTGALGGFAKLF